MSELKIEPKKETKTTKAKPKAVKPKVEQVKEPTLTSFGLTREKDGWYFLEFKSEGDKIVNTERTGPLMRAIAVEEFKICSQRMIEGLA